MERYGASPEDWLHFDIILGLTADLLPVISNPNAEISDKSTLKSIGKTPSRYNRDGKAVGFANWTSYITKSVQIEQWAKNSDYGICVQTRNVRAIDVDVSDPALAEKIKAYISKTLEIEIPCRYRDNSSKFLLMFEMPGEFTKQIIKISDGNIIEFLANGQQFIAVGTHISGEPYKWFNGLPDSIPVLSSEQFNNLWQGLADIFNGDIVSTRVSKNRDISKNQSVMSDEITQYLDEHWNVYGEGKAGERYIECPFADSHTTESNETATAYFPASTGGFEQGHFRCLHAHCMSKDDGDFLNAIGYRAQDFNIIPTSPHEKPLPKFVRDKNGKIESTINNVYLAVQRSDICGLNIRFDEFRDEIMYTVGGDDQWLTFSDADYSRLRIGLEKGGFKPIGRELIRDIVLLVADENPFDSATEWLSRLEWDGVPRVATFLSDYFNAEQSEYTKAVSLYLWTALAGRVLSPGIKADMVPILVSSQGKLKSTVISALAPAQEHFCEIAFSENEDNLARKMRGKLVAEIGELRGLHTKELESIKAFITRTHENWVPKFKEFAVQYPRRLVFIGTTNKDEFLDDETGNRRFLPVRVGLADLANIIKYREQFWAEGRELFKKHGILYKQAEELGAAEHDQYMLKDPWEDAVLKWLIEPDMLTDEKPIDKPYLRSGDVLQHALKIEPRNIKRGDEMRIGKTLAALGYVRKVVRNGDKTQKAFVKKS